MKVLEYLRSEPLDSDERGPTLAAVVREIIVLVVWVALLIPRDPGWSIAGYAWFHWAAAAAVAWGIVLYILYKKGTFVSLATLLTLALDLAGISVLVHFTGGAHSPFIVLYFLLVLNGLVLVPTAQTLSICLTTVAAFGSMLAMVQMGLLHQVEPFVGGNIEQAGILYLLTTSGLFLLFILYALIASFFLQRGLHEHEVALRESSLERSQTQGQLMECFHNLEEMSYRLNASADVLDSNRVQLVTTDRLATQGRIAAAVLHNIRNPLTSILNLAELQCMALERIDGAAAQVDNAMKIISYAQRIQRLIENLSQAVVGRADERFIPLDVNDLIERSLSLCEQLITEGEITLEKELQTETPMALGVPGQVEQVLLNLVENACYYMMQGTERTLSVSTRTEGEWLLIEVADTGAGIESPTMERIFEPFFTTKPSNEGMGLGLYLAQIILQEHGGRIDLESQPGQGTRATIKLPLLPSREHRARDIPDHQEHPETEEPTPPPGFEANAHMA